MELVDKFGCPRLGSVVSWKVNFKTESCMASGEWLSYKKGSNNTITELDTGNMTSWTGTLNLTRVNK